MHYIKARDEQTVLSEITLEINYFLKHTELERDQFDGWNVLSV